MKHAARHKQNNSNSITIVCTIAFIIGIIIAAISLNRIIANNDDTNTSMTSMYSNSDSGYNTSSSSESSSVVQYNDDNKNCIGECK